MKCGRERLESGIRSSLLALAMVAPACKGGTVAAPLACTVGDTRECVGPANCRGGQTCLPDRTGWTSCDCGPATTVPPDLRDSSTDASAEPPDDAADASTLDRVDSDAYQPPTEAGVDGSPPREAGIDASPSPDSGPAPPGCSPGEDRAIDLDQNQVADCAETMVNNSQFVSSTTGWIPWSSSVITLEWTNDDARASTASGSMKVTNAVLSDAAMSSTLGALQCVPVVGGLVYLVAGQFKIPAGQVNPSANVQVFFYSDDLCQTFLASGRVRTDGGFGTWTTFSGRLQAITGSRSAHVRLDAVKDFTNPPVTVLYDNILFRPES